MDRRAVGRLMPAATVETRDAAAEGEVRRIDALPDRVGRLAIDGEIGQAVGLDGLERREACEKRVGDVTVGDHGAAVADELVQPLAPRGEEALVGVHGDQQRVVLLQRQLIESILAGGLHTAGGAGRLRQARQGTIGQAAGEREDAGAHAKSNNAAGADCRARAAIARLRSLSFHRGHRIVGRKAEQLEEAVGQHARAKGGLDRASAQAEAKAVGDVGTRVETGFRQGAIDDVGAARRSARDEFEGVAHPGAGMATDDRDLRPWRRHGWRQDLEGAAQALEGDGQHRERRLAMVGSHGREADLDRFLLAHHPQAGCRRENRIHLRLPPPFDPDVRRAERRRLARSGGELRRANRRSAIHYCSRMPSAANRTPVASPASAMAPPRRPAARRQDVCA